jgi:hypothetical protein
MFLQQLRNEITRQDIDYDQIGRDIDRNLNVAGNRVMDSAWRHIDSVYKTGVSNAQGQIDLNSSVVSSYSDHDLKRTNELIEQCLLAVQKQNTKLKSDIIKQIEKNPIITVLLKTVRDHMTQVFIPSVVTVTQTYAGAAYNEAVYSRVSKVAPYKKWCFVADSNGQPYHASMNDIQVDMDQPFLVSGFELNKTKDIPPAEMMFPHDNKSRPHSMHLEDCRCFVVGVF